MQEAGFRAAGLAWSYRLLDVAPDQLAEAVERLRGDEWAGANVTIPHKLAVVPFLDVVDEETHRLGAVNCIQRQGTSLVGSNTDVDGIRAALLEVGIADTNGLEVVILGVGGSARACAAALPGSNITWVSRRDLPPPAAGRLLRWSEPQWREVTRSADLLLNATPIGRAHDMPCAIEDLPAAGAVIDLVYASPTTPLAAAARAAGRPAADGWTVLLGQGAASFTAWTGLPAPLEAMRAALPA